MHVSGGIAHTMRRMRDALADAKPHSRAPVDAVNVIADQQRRLYYYILVQIRVPAETTRAVLVPVHTTYSIQVVP